MFFWILEVGNSVELQRYSLDHPQPLSMGAQTVILYRFVMLLTASLV